MKLPNAENAVVDVRKLRDYCLSAAHPRGRYKAKVFSSALGMTSPSAAELRDALLRAAREAEAVPTETDQYGQRYVVDCTISGPGGQARVRSMWIVRCEEDFPRLTSCYVL